MSKLIGKTLAADVAKNLANNAFVADIEASSEALKHAVDEIVWPEIPADIADMFRKNPKYFNTCSSVRVENSENSSDDGYFPCNSFPSTNSWNPTFVVSKEILDGLRIMKDREKTLRKGRDEAERAARNLLLELKTFKRIQEVFPEAYALIPVSELEAGGGASLSIPVNTVKALLRIKAQTV